MEFLSFFSPEMTWNTSLILFAVLGALLCFSAIKNQQKTLKISERALKIQEESHQKQMLILQELKRSHRVLCMLADVAPEDINRLPSSEENSELLSQTKLYVGNIDYAASEAELADHFSRFGKIEFVNIPVNRYNGRARGFGFVTFTSTSDAERAMTLNGSEFRGRQIQVNFAKERD